MRIVYIRTNAVNPDPRVEKEINSLLLDKNLDIKILAWDRSDNYDRKLETLELPNGSVKIIRFGCKASWGGGMKQNLRAVLKFIILVKKWLKENRMEYDCIHACDLIPGYFALKYSKKYNKKLVYDIFDYYPDCHKTSDFLRNIFIKMENKVIKNADCTIICSEQRKMQIGNCAPKKLEVIHNSPSKSMFENLNNNICMSKNSNIKIVYVGNLVNERYILELLNIVSAMQNIELHIGGIGVLEDEISRFSEKNKNIIYYGKLKYGDVLSLENACDIMVALYDPLIINHKYAAPNKVYEAMFLGKPLIMFKDTGMDKIISNNNVGVVVDANVDSIEAGILELVSNKNEWNNIGLKMKKLFLEYNWEIMEQRLLDIYKELQE